MQTKDPKIQYVLAGFGLGFSKDQIHQLGNGHINTTFLLDGPAKFVLQRINKKVFKDPEIIASNLRTAAQHLSKNHPSYLFLKAIKTKKGDDMMYDETGDAWRLFPFINNTMTIESASTIDEAFEAAKGFAALSKNLDGIDVKKFKPSIERFQDLTLRFEQLETAIQNANENRKKEAALAIEMALSYSHLVKEHEELINTGKLKPRIIHNDTKINNILFDSRSQKAVAVIDLDTLMPGYFIYDLGDMVRTYVSPVNEEEPDLNKISFRFPFYEKILEGYLSEMGECLTEDEKEAIPFAGLMMTYIMAIRFLADYLNGDIYYHTQYPNQNLVRACNQLRLLALINQNVRPVVDEEE